MAKTFRSWDVDQAVLFPPSLRDLVPEGHLAHFVRDVVREQLDLSEIYAAYTEERGFPPYHPAMMTALLLYGYCRGIRSSRKLEQSCEERVDFMAVTGRAKPDHTRISEFRRRHRAALQGLFAQVVTLCREAGLVSLGHVAIDGTKVQANASKHAAMSYGRMKKAQRELRAQIKAWFEEADAADEDDDRRHGKGRRGDELPDWVKSKEARLAKISEAKKRLEEQAAAEGEDEPDEKAQSNFTDPESRIMKTGDGFVQAYNCQAAVDAASHVVVARDVVPRGIDHEELTPMLDRIEAQFDDLPAEVSADAGYCNESNLKEIEQRGIRGYVATGRQRHGEPAAVRPCRGVKSHRWPSVLRMRIRLRRGGWRSRYRLRKQTVEPVFGRIKEALGLRRFLQRGLANVAAEWSLACTAHNLLKLAKTRLATG
jgi:transposase